MALSVPEVSIWGVSMGGVSAIKFVEKYGAKKLFLWSAITNAYLPND